jgi:purine-binding chemotaxis protein CheW
MNAVVTQSTATAAQTSSQYLTFSLGGEMYGLAILNVKEIIEFGQITEVPMMPKTIRGVINLRGAVVPVVDLLARFFGTRTEAGKRTCIVIIELGQDAECPVMGLIVDAVSEVLEIAAAEIEPPPAFGSHVRTDFIEGMGKIGGHFVMLLNAPAVLANDELAELALPAPTAGPRGAAHP